MSTASFPDTALTLGALLRRPYEILAARTYAELARQGFPDIRQAHSAVFRYLGPDGARVTELAQQAGMTKQSMAYLVDSLAASAYLRLEADPADGRAKRVHLTERGTAAVETLLRLSAEQEAALLRALGEGEAQQLRKLLETLYAATRHEAAGNG